MQLFRTLERGQGKQIGLLMNRCGSEFEWIESKHSNLFIFKILVRLTSECLFFAYLVAGFRFVNGLEFWKSIGVFSREENLLADLLAVKDYTFTGSRYRQFVCRCEPYPRAQRFSGRKEVLLKSFQKRPKVAAKDAIRDSEPF